MLNFIRFDAHKLFISKGFWITLLLMTIGCSFVGYMTYETANQTYEDYINMTNSYNEAINEEADSEEEGGIIFETKPIEEGTATNEFTFNIAKSAIRERIKTNLFISTVTGMIIVLYNIYSAMTIGNDFTSGYLKNMLAIRGAKWKWITSKIFLAFLIFTCLYLIAFAVGLILETSINGFPTNFDLVSLAKGYGLNLIFAIILMLLNIAIALLTQSKVTLVVLATLISMGLHKTMIQLADTLLKTNIHSYLYSVRSSSYLMGDGQNLVTILITGACFMIGLYLFNRIYIYQTDFNFDH